MLAEPDRQPTLIADEPAADSDTGRLEAFSDGVFAVAITLLVLDLHVPVSRDLDPYNGDVFRYMSSQWPHYLAYVTSFLFILVMWINHHTLFKLIGRADNVLMILNGLLLMLVTIVPFSTSLLAEFLRDGSPTNQREVAIVYNGVYVVLAIVFNALWRYASAGRRLLDDRAHPKHVQSISDAYRWGPVYYVAALLLALVSIPASLVLNIALAVYFALPRTRRQKDAGQLSNNRRQRRRWYHGPLPRPRD